jgi:hypothetical protein
MRTNVSIAWVPSPGSDLANLGRAWTGYDPDALDDVMRPRGPRVIERFDRRAHRYRANHSMGTPEICGLPPGLLRARTVGRTATGLSAPLRPGLGVDASRMIEVASCVARAAASSEAITTAPLQLAWVDRCLCLVPERTSDALQQLAAKCAEVVDSVREPLTGAEVASFRSRGLSLREELMLLRWGHPHVHDGFVFRITLTDEVPDSERRAFEVGASSFFGSVLGHRLVIDELCLLKDRMDGTGMCTAIRSPMRQVAELIPA